MSPSPTKRRRKSLTGYGYSPGKAEREIGLWVNSAGHYNACDHICPLRVRDDNIIIYCVAGKGSYFQSERRFDIGAGQIFVTLPGLQHAYQSDSREGWEIWWCHFQGDQTQRLLTSIGFSLANLIIPIGLHPRLIQAFRRIVRILKNKEVNCGLDSSTALFAMLMELKKITQIRRKEGLEILAATDGEPVDVQSMARSAGMSKYHFIREFKRMTGITPWRYLMARRMSRAKELLIDSSLSIKQIAFSLGFNDPNYFSRLFRKETGVSAREFREQQHS